MASGQTTPLANSELKQGSCDRRARRRSARHRRAWSRPSCRCSSRRRPGRGGSRRRGSRTPRRSSPPSAELRSAPSPPRPPRRRRSVRARTASGRSGRMHRWYPRREAMTPGSVRRRRAAARRRTVRARRDPPRLGPRPISAGAADERRDGAAVLAQRRADRLAVDGQHARAVARDDARRARHAPEHRDLPERVARAAARAASRRRRSPGAAAEQHVVGVLVLAVGGRSARRPSNSSMRLRANSRARAARPSGCSSGARASAVAGSIARRSTSGHRDLAARRRARRPATAARKSLARRARRARRRSRRGPSRRARSSRSSASSPNWLPRSSTPTVNPSISTVSRPSADEIPAVGVRVALADDLSRRRRGVPCAAAPRRPRARRRAAGRTAARACSSSSMSTRATARSSMPPKPRRASATATGSMPPATNSAPRTPSAPSSAGASRLPHALEDELAALHHAGDRPDRRAGTIRFNSVWAPTSASDMPTPQTTMNAIAGTGP